LSGFQSGFECQINSTISLSHWNTNGGDEFLEMRYNQNMFFNKKAQSPADTISMSTLKTDGKMYLLRFDRQFHGSDRQKEFPFQVGIALPTITDNNGFPSKEENSQLLVIEDQLIKKLTSQNTSVWVGTITGGKVKEFIFYTKDPEKVKLLFE
jgi:hypothetical protein